MPRARSILGKTWSTRVAAWLSLAMACADDAPAAVVEPAAVDVPSAVVTAPGDPLLTRARVGIREGALPGELEAEVLGSSAVEHARARRVLLAMAEPPPGPGSDEPADDEAQDARLRPPPISSAGDPEGGLGSEPSPAPASDPSRSKSSSGTSRAPAPPPSRARADLGGLVLRTTKRGATLTIAAPSSLVVGVANQPASGLVRLVIESAHAGSAVLGARPKTEGAAVTGVRQGQGTVQITIALEPGWTLGSVQPFSGGAKVHLVAPR